MSWNERWEALSPGLRRGLVLAGGALAIILERAIHHEAHGRNTKKNNA
jgi:hypothetical protein